MSTLSTFRKMLHHMTTITNHFQAIQAAQSDAELEHILGQVDTGYDRGELPRATVETLVRLMMERERQLYRQEHPEYSSCPAGCRREANLLAVIDSS